MAIILFTKIISKLKRAIAYFLHLIMLTISKPKNGTSVDTSTTLNQLFLKLHI